MAEKRPAKASMEFRGLHPVPGPGDLCSFANNPLERYGPGRDKLAYAQQVNQIHDFSLNGSNPGPFGTATAPASAQHTVGLRAQSPARDKPKDDHGPTIIRGIVRHYRHD